MWNGSPGQTLIDIEAQLIPLVYLVYREALSSVFASQVLTPLEEHRDVARVSLGLLTPVGHLLRGQYRPALDRIQDRCRKSRIDVGWIPSPPTRTPWLWSDRLLLRQWLVRRFPGEEPFVIRCRGSEMTCLALDACRGWTRAKVIYDCRGAEVFESVQQSGLGATPREHWTHEARSRIDHIGSQERRAVTESAGVTCVSQAMVESLQDRYPALSPDKFCVVPCCPHVESFTQAVAGRDAVRRELGLQDKFVVSYLGSLVWYQLPEESLRVFRLIRSHCLQAHFLAITTDPHRMRVLTEQAGLASQDVTIRSVPPPEVPRLLVASDLGLMLRDTTETNRVASPVKFGEYLAAGVPVAVSTHLGDCTGIVDRARLGVVVNLEDDDAALSAQLKQFLDSTEPQDAWRSRCQDYARQHLSWQRYLPPLGEWYGRLLAGSPSLVSAKEAR